MLITIPPMLMGARLPPAPPQTICLSHSARSQSDLSPAPPHQCLASLLLPVPCMHRTANCWDVCVCSQGVTSWLWTPRPLGAGNIACLRLHSFSYHLCMNYARGCAFVSTRLWWYDHRQTPSQLLTPSHALGEMQSAENRMGQDNHDIEKHNLAKNYCGQARLTLAWGLERRGCGNCC